MSAHFLTTKYNGLHLLVCLGVGLIDFLLLYLSFVVNQCFGHIPTFAVTQHICAERGGRREPVPFILKSVDRKWSLARAGVPTVASLTCYPASSLAG